MGTDLPVFFIYGNHGEAPSQLEDYYQLTSDLFGKLAGRPVVPARRPVKNALNILVEAFDEGWAESLRRLKADHPETKFICFATEFITKNTFNDFESLLRQTSEPPKPSIVGSSMPKIVPVGLRSFLNTSIPWLYKPLKRIYYATFGRNPHIFDPYYHYDNLQGWHQRFIYFRSLVETFDFVWCVSEHQLDGYRAILSPDKLRWVPPLPYSQAEQPQPREFAYDFVFTGIVNERRQRLLDQLVSRGYKVATAPPTFSSAMRADLIDASAVALHIKQKSNWAFPSNMRMDFLLRRNKIVVSEMSELPCFQSKFVFETDEHSFLETCLTARSKAGERSPVSDAYSLEAAPMIAHVVQQLKADLNSASQTPPAHENLYNLQPIK